MIKFIFAVLALLLPLAAVRGHCGTRDISKEQEAKFARLVANQKEAGSIGNSRRLKRFAATVPVYFHVFSPDDTITITDTQIADQMDVMNTAYASAGFKFQLMVVNRIIDPVLYSGYDGSDPTFFQDFILQNRVGCLDALNVLWVDLSNTDGTLGYSYLPGFEANAANDYVVMSVTTIPGGTPPYDEGDSLVHEVGHWLFLNHPFRSDDETCERNDDGISDTPVQLNGATITGIGCPPPNTMDTCPGYPGYDSVNNYMSYYADICLVSFTDDQVVRMQYAWEIYRTVGGEFSYCAINAGGNKRRIRELHHSTYVWANNNKGYWAKSANKSMMWSKGKGYWANGKGYRTKGKGYWTKGKGYWAKGKGYWAKGKGKGGKDKDKGGNPGPVVLVYNVETQLVVPVNVPVCNGVLSGNHVRWFEFEGAGKESMIKVESANVYTTLTVTTGDPSLSCIGATASAVPSSTGNTRFTFFAEDNVPYYVAVTTFSLTDAGTAGSLSDPITVSITI